MPTREEKGVLTLHLTPVVKWWTHAPSVYEAIDHTLKASTKRWTGISETMEVSCKNCKYKWSDHLAPDRKCPFEPTHFGFTDEFRRALTGDINRNQDDRATLEGRYGEIWDTKEVQDQFHIQGFLAPFVGVTRKSDMAEGALMFQHHPRYYFCFMQP